MSENSTVRDRKSMRPIDIKDLWRIFLECFWIMAIAAVAVMVVMFIFVKITYKPKYESTASIYILKNESEKALTSSDFSVALNVVDDCTFALKSHAVLDKVIEDLGLDTTYKKLYSSISVTNPKSTRYLQVTVTADTPEQAKEIVDSVCDNGVERIDAAMGVHQANIFEKGVLNTNPSNKTRLRYYVLAGAAAAVLVYAVFLIIFLLDDSIRTEEDIKEILGLTILGDIPNADEASGEKYKGSKYKKYERTKK